MENKQLSGGYFPSNVNSDIVEEFLGCCYQENGTTYGAYTKELLWIIEKQIDVFEGKLEVVEVMDQRASALFAHMKKESKTNFLTNETNFFRKNKRSGSTRVYINKCPIKWLNRVRHFLIDNFNSKYGSSSYLTMQAMKLDIKLKKGFIKLVETKKEVDNSFISDEGGQISSIEDSTVVKMFTSLVSKVSSLENEIKELKESTVQSVKDVSSKVRSKVNKGPNSKGKSGKAKAKLDKAERILNNLKKRYEHRFTNKQYREPLAKLEKQGDPRTPVVIWRP